MSHLFSVLYRTIIDALFPLSPVERELFSWSPAEAVRILHPAPDFSGLALPLPGARSVFAYKDERVAKLVWNIKYKRSVRAVKIGGYALFHALNMGVDSIRDATSPTHILILPIPITTRRRRERGYNQCELLLDEMERLAENEADKRRDLGESSGTRLIFEKNLLIRTQHAARQTLKGRADRLESARGIFGVNEKMLEKSETDESVDSNLTGLKDSKISLKKIPVILIDDVITTGSTMHEAIDTLKKIGFEDVRALSLAH